MRQQLSLEPSVEPDARPEWTTNAEALTAWRAYQATRIAPDTVRHYGYEIERFLRAWQAPVWTLERSELWRYVRAYTPNCRNYRRTSAIGESCTKGQDLAACGATCPTYEVMSYATVSGHLQALVCFYDFLDHVGLANGEAARRVRRDWQRENRHRKRHAARRVPTLQELALLLRRDTPIHRRAAYAIMAKGGWRIGECIRLQTDSRHFDLRAGWLHLPMYHGKRRGNRSLPIDDDLHRVLAEYLPWREAAMKKAGQQHDALLVTPDGTPYSRKTGPSNLNRALKADQVRVGVADAATQPFTAHGFRHYFSDGLKKRGCDDYWWNVLRGDLPRMNLGIYVHPQLDDIQQQYRNHAPRIP